MPAPSNKGSGSKQTRLTHKANLLNKKKMNKKNGEVELELQ